MYIEDTEESPRRSTEETRPTGIGLSGTQRAMSGAAGTLLSLWGLRRGGVGGLLGAIAGGALIARAATGHSLVSGTAAEKAFAAEQGWNAAALAEESVIINRPRSQLYAFWRDFANLPMVMSHVARVDVLDRMRSHWVMELPMGKQVEWTSTVTDDQPNQRIAWRADEDAQIANSGWVEFREAPGGQGTEVRVQIAYQPPAGEIGQLLVKLWPQSPGALLQDDLREFKSRIEAGEISLPPLGSIPPLQH